MIFLDYRLPDSQDLTLLQKIRTAAPDCPVIMMTAYRTPERSRPPSGSAPIESSANRSTWAT